MKPFMDAKISVILLTDLESDIIRTSVEITLPGDGDGDGGDPVEPASVFGLPL